jgi:CreA protein
MKRLFALCAVLAAIGCARADSVGEVDTVFKFIGPDHKIVVDAHDDPKVQGVTCYVSRAKTGGIKGAVGLAEDKAEASIACRQVGPISFAGRCPCRRRCSASASRWSSSGCGWCAWSTRSAIRSST